MDKIYFSQKTENAIMLYNEETNPVKKSLIYKQSIEKPLNKLVENIINRFKFPYMQEMSISLKEDVISFLILNMDKYNSNKGKAFSYFSILAKNYLIIGNNDEYKHKKSQLIINPHDVEVGIDVIDEAQDKIINDDTPEFIKLMIRYWELNLPSIFSKRYEMMIADAIINLFKRCKNIENFNKKSLYVMIREMTGLKTQYITSVVNVMKKHNKELLRKYQKSGYFDPDEVLIKF